jgi:hypothetical protein
MINDLLRNRYSLVGVRNVVGDGVMCGIDDLAVEMNVSDYWDVVYLVGEMGLVGQVVFFGDKVGYERYRRDGVMIWDGEVGLC